MIELKTPFTVDQAEWLKDHLISLEMWFASEERAIRKLKEKLFLMVQEIRRNTEKT